MSEPATHREPGATAPRPPSPAPAHWREPLGILNLRGDPGNPVLREAVQTVLGVDLPPSPGGVADGSAWRVVAVGPDDWFLIGPADASEAMFAALAQALAGLHAALTDVGSGYRVLRLTGPGAIDVLAQGCPLDLHPRAFGEGRCAGSHFFKASVWLWRAGDGFELLVRRSFRGYVELMLARAAGLP